MKTDPSMNTAMEFILAQLDRDHGNVSRLLDILEYQLMRHERGQPFDTSLCMNILRYMTEYQDVFHHPREDLLFAKLALRCADVTVELEQIEAEHAVLTSMGAELYRDLVDLENNDCGHDEVATQMTAYVSMLRDHMKRESSQAFPLARIVLLDRDWEDIEDALEIDVDPLFGPAVEASYRDLVKQVGSHNKA